MSNSRRDYLSLPEGSTILTTKGETVKVRYGQATFATMEEDGYHYRARYPTDEEYVVPFEQAIILPVHIRFAQENFETSIAKNIERHHLQTCVQNPPRELPTGRPYRMPPLATHMTTDECMLMYPNLVKAMGIGSYFGSSEAGSCIRFYRDGYQFGGDAVSYNGGTPLDALIGTMRGMASLVSGRHNLGDEIAYMTLNQSTGWLDLMWLDRCMWFLLERHTHLQQERRAQYANRD